MRGVQLLLVPAVVIAALGLLAVQQPGSNAFALVMAVLSGGAGLWWIKQLNGPHRDAWVWPGLATLLVPVAAIARMIDSSLLTGAIVEVCVLAVPTIGLAVVSAPRLPHAGPSLAAARAGRTQP